MKRFSSKVAEKLKYYVYLYVDPRNDSVFYIGKGKGNRAFSHGHQETKASDDSESRKIAMIRELRALGLEPRIELLKYGLTEKEALLVEATAIDLLQIENLTNESLGHGSRIGTRATAEEVAVALDASEAKIVHPVLLIVINRAFRYGMTPMELYDATRSAWKIGSKRDKICYALSVYRGIVREVYEVTGWVPGGLSIRNDDLLGRRPREKGRWEFVGVAAPDEIRKRYVGKSVARYFKQGAQNPIQYVSC